MLCASPFVRSGLTGAWQMLVLEPEQKNSMARPLNASPLPRDSEAGDPVSLEAYPVFCFAAPLSVRVQVHTSSTDTRLHADQRTHEAWHLSTAALKRRSQLAPGQDALRSCFHESFIKNTSKKAGPIPSATHCYHTVFPRPWWMASYSQEPGAVRCL